MYIIKVNGWCKNIKNIDRYESYLRIISDVLGVKDYSKILNSVKYK